MSNFGGSFLPFQAPSLGGLLHTNRHVYDALAEAAATWLRKWAGGVTKSSCGSAANFTRNTFARPMPSIQRTNPTLNQISRHMHLWVPGVVSTFLRGDRAGGEEFRNLWCVTFNFDGHRGPLSLYILSYVIDLCVMHKPDAFHCETLAREVVMYCNVDSIHDSFYPRTGSGWVPRGVVHESLEVLGW